MEILFNVKICCTGGERRFNRGICETEEVAVIRIKIRDCNEKCIGMVNQHASGILESVNVLKIYGYDENPVKFIWLVIIYFSFMF